MNIWKTGKRAASGPPKKIAKVAVDVSVEAIQVEDEYVKTKLAEELSRIRMVEQPEMKLKGTESVEMSICSTRSECGDRPNLVCPTFASKKRFGFRTSLQKGQCSVSIY